MASLGLSRLVSASDKQVQMEVSVPNGKGAASEVPFQPCAATASLLLYAQGSVVLCLHHDTLAVERRFHKHTDDIQLISVDNVSETGAGRLVVTYDTKQTAIVWDLFTGEQISRFASYEPLKVAAWMRNGNVAFGTSILLQCLSDAKLVQAMARVRSSCSSLRPASMSLHAPSLILSQLLDRPQIARRMPLGTITGQSCWHLYSHLSQSYTPS